MKISLKLYATLTDYLPIEARRENRVELEVPADATIESIITPLNLPQKLVHLVLVNGVYIPPESRATHRFSADDVLAIWPPIAGG